MWIPTLSIFRRRRRFLPIFFFFFYFYYYKIMIMTIMIMKTIMIVFNLNQNAYPKRKCAYSFCVLLIVSFETSVRSSRPGSSKDGFNQEKKFKPGLSQRFSCL